MTSIMQSSFYGGVADDARTPLHYRRKIFSTDEFVIAKHFDIFTQPFRLVPYRSLIADTNDGSTSTGMKQYFVKDFLYASASTKLYGLGQNGSAKTKVVYKADATTGNWTLPASSEGNGAVLNGCLVEYKDYLWGFQGTTQVWKWGLLSGAGTITNTAGTVGTVYSTVTVATINAGGSGYNVNDVLTVATGNKSATVIVTAVSAGVITAVTILAPGYNYTAGSGVATTVSPVGGTGATLNITVGDTSDTISSVAQGVIAKDDNLYLAYNNIIVRVYPSGTVQDQALKLPTNLKINSICNFGNYLAIGCAPKNPFNGVSKVYLWNLTSPDIQESIDWGEGELRILETIDGMLVGITDRYLNNSVGAGKGSMIIQTYSGGSPLVVKEIFTQKLTGQVIPQTKSVKNNRLFFAAKIFTNTAGTEYNEGLWSYGRKNGSYPSALSLDIIDENVTTSGIQSFGTAANYFFVAHSADGSIDKTDSSANYTFTSIIETLLFDFVSADADKRLTSVKVFFPLITTGQSCTLKYKTDEATSWTTIGTYNTVGGLAHTFVNLEASGNASFSTGKEIQLRLESTGGLEIKGYEVNADILAAV